MTNMLNGVNFEDYLKLTKKQREYIRIKNETDLSDKEIAIEINTPQPSISRWKTNDKFKAGLMAYQAHHLESSVPQALQTMISLLNAKSELVKFQAAKDILDRTGYNPIDKQEVEHTGSVQFVDDI
ncbi:DNA-binding protein [Staphylococcus simulans]|uniref:DNA-binding protein n=1 Tax=Staphylococcus simulans TaxID=1286 RepID=UPI000D1D59C1|nr:DNA-binding protein [Staphylococcus simulans]MDQ7113912.1 DNA-binding protein [Staphylococcus simulans]MDQ7117677.1 DNA-binding protein [Staphylococcus simulans]PTJ14062.1 DNA-binding protein [Staphylococcus simulans]PTJ32870.1 DNA-binding protein [Staphylococcus simulans]PTJ42118.1 DNA-binding protein [Staphylococcus simulans]